MRKDLLVSGGINVAKSHDLVYILEPVQDRQLHDDEINNHVEILNDYAMSHVTRVKTLTPRHSNLMRLKSTEAIKLAVLERVNSSQTPSTVLCCSFTYTI